MINKLTDRACRQKPSASIKRLTDGGGMFLEVHPNGRRYWRMAYRFAGKQKQLAFGVFPDVSVATARQKRDDARALLAQGIDPIEHREQQEREAKRRAAAEKSLSALTDEWFLVKVDREGKDEATKKRNRSLVRYLKAAPLGDRPAAEIEAPELLEVLRGIEADGHLETAHRVQRLASRIFRFGVATGVCKRDPAADLTGALTASKVTPRPAITDPTAFGQLLRDLNAYGGTALVRFALGMLALTLVRPGEVRKAEWREFDLDNAKWVIPAHKMKMRLEHEVPLSPQAVAILEAVRPITGSGQYVFGVNGGRKPLSDATLGKALRIMGYDTQTEHCAHGFRSSGSTLLNGERRSNGDPAWHPDVVELSLAHVDDNSVRAVYNRAKLWPERVRLMQHWADRLDAMRDGAKLLKLEKRA